jgi:hypothetical protein
MSWQWCNGKWTRALDDDDRAEALEARADDEYGRAIPRDQTLVDRSAPRLAEDPDAFNSV